MPDIRAITSQAVHDALALRGLEDGGGGFIRTASPSDYMGADRLRLARQLVPHLPPGASVTFIEKLVQQLLPVVAASLKPVEDAAAQAPLRLHS